MENIKISDAANDLAHAILIEFYNMQDGNSTVDFVPLRNRISLALTAAAAEGRRLAWEEVAVHVENWVFPLSKQTPNTFRTQTELAAAIRARAAALANKPAGGEG